MKTALKFFAFITLAATLSFGATLFFLGVDFSTSENKRIAAVFTARENLRSSLGRLEICRKSNPDPSVCGAFGAVLFQHFEQAPAETFGFYRAGHFNVAVFEDYLLAFKAICSAADQGQDKYRLNVWPLNLELLSAEQKASGAASSFHSFAESGHINNAACIMAVRLPFREIAYIEFGRMNSQQGGWHWRTHDKL
jgi:hypothetical protein